MLSAQQEILIYICFLLLMVLKISSLTRLHVLINFPSIWLMFYRSKDKILSPRKTLSEDNMQNIKAATIKTKITYPGFFISSPFLFLFVLLTGDTY